MRRKPTMQVERCRVAGRVGSNEGWFRFLLTAPNPGDGPLEHVELRVVASTGGGWDHVSVSTATRCPTWEEMEFVRGLFFRDCENVLQFSVPRYEHINCHPNCLHLWRNQAVEVALPPAWMVGPQEAPPPGEGTQPSAPEASPGPDDRAYKALDRIASRAFLVESDADERDQMVAEAKAALGPRLKVTSFADRPHVEHP